MRLDQPGLKVRLVVHACIWKVLRWIDVGSVSCESEVELLVGPSATGSRDLHAIHARFHLARVTRPSAKFRSPCFTRVHAVEARSTLPSASSECLSPIDARGVEW